MGSLPAGMGWRGPDRTCPGRAGGRGRAGGGVGRPGEVAAGGAVGTAGGGETTRGGSGSRGWGGGATVGAWGCDGEGELPANGGRMGSAGRPAGRSGMGFGATGSEAAASSTTVGAGAWLTGAAGASSRKGAVSTAAAGCSVSMAARGSGSVDSSGAFPLSSRRNRIATSSSIELEWVFFSVTPNSGSLSRISCALTSSSRASSLIRILFIDTKLSRGDAPYSLCEPPSSDSS